MASTACSGAIRRRAAHCAAESVSAALVARMRDARSCRDARRPGEADIMCQGAFSLRCVVGIRRAPQGTHSHHCGTSTSTFSTLTSVPARARLPPAGANSTQAPRHPCSAPTPGRAPGA